MASPKMVDMRQLNPQQLTEVAKRIDTELQVLQNCQNELLSGKVLEQQYIMHFFSWILFSIRIFEISKKRLLSNGQFSSCF